jgi:predicted GNAT family N-acyltransferase
MALSIQHLEKSHSKSTFDCGHSLLNDYIKKQEGQDVRRDLSACFVLTDEKDVVNGFYTLSANSIKKDEFPELLQKKLPPNYTDIATILLGRLAIDNTRKGNGWGEFLLVDALFRCLDISESLGTMAVVVDPIDKTAQSFYEKYGFILLPGSGKMFLPIKTIKQL